MCFWAKSNAKVSDKWGPIRQTMSSKTKNVTGVDKENVFLSDDSHIISVHGHQTEPHPLKEPKTSKSVSYTHLTLPTIYSV